MRTEEVAEANATRPNGGMERFYSGWLAAFAGVLVYLPTLWYGFVWDDRYAIVGNPSLQSWKSLGAYFWGTVDPAVTMYRPVTAAFVTLEFHLFGLQAWGYHLTSVVLHALVCAMVYRVALQLCESKAVAMFASLLFALHAAHLEAVAWVSALAEPLMMAATLAGFGFYLNYRKERKGMWLAATCASLFLGLLCKETAIVLPLLIVVFEITNEEWKLPSILKVLPALAALSLTAIVYMAMRRAVYTGFVYHESKLPLTTLIFTWPSLLLIYVQHLVVPTPLSPFYDNAYVTTANASFWLPLLALAGIGVAIYFASRRLVSGGRARFCGLAMVIAIVPALELNVFQFREILHDRFLYMPSAFFAILLGLLLFGSRGQKDGTQTSSRPLYAALGGALILLNLTALLIQSPVWKNDLALLSYAARIAPGNPRPAFGLATEYLKKGDLPRAEVQLEHVVQLVPAPTALFSLGQTRLLMGHAAAAEEPLRRAIAAAADRPGQHLALGDCLRLLGRTGEARAEYKAEIAIAPDYREIAGKKLAQLPSESGAEGDKSR
jgi:tetratricopeptide (TPR) repeat protein